MTTEPTPARPTAGSLRDALDPAVLVGALGYFVDTFDMLLFTVLRVSSLTELHVAAQDLVGVTVRVLNFQMAGMLLGGLFWGIMGDRVGRRSVLFGSILLYSGATVGCGLVQSVDEYAWLRFISGFGLAGEFGAAITLVSERLPAASRGYGTMVVSSVGLLGALCAGLVGNRLDWRQAYFLGGGLGVMLLFLRIASTESHMFHQTLDSDVRRGDLRMLLQPKRLGTFLRCVVVGIPIHYTAAILMAFSPELAAALGTKAPVTAGDTVTFLFAGLTIGDVLSGWLSQRWHSRKKVILHSLLVLAAVIVVLLGSWGLTPAGIYCIYFGLGIATGYWTIFATTSAEQFGTNLRSTVTTTAPNLVRGSTILLTLSFRSASTSLGYVGAAMVVGFVCITLAYLAGLGLQETFGRDLNFFEE